MVDLDIQGGNNMESNFEKFMTEEEKRVNKKINELTNAFQDFFPGDDGNDRAKRQSSLNQQEIMFYIHSLQRALFHKVLQRIFPNDIIF